MSALINALRGGVAPWLVGLLRGIAEAAVFAAATIIVIFLTSANVPDALVPWVPIILVIFRTAEGVLDHIDPSTDRSIGDQDPFAS